MTTSSSIATTEEIVKGAEKRLTALIQEVNVSVQDIKDVVKELKTKVDGIEHDVAVQGTEINKVRSEMADHKKNYSTLERQYILKDIHDRKPNLLFYGITETPKENTEQVLKTFFIDKLNFPADTTENMLLKTAYHLPKSEYQRNHNPSAPRSIIATFIKMSDRDDVFDARKVLKGTGISVQTDLPAMMKKRLAILSRQVNEIREEKNLWTRVRVLGTEIVLEVKEPHNPSSPWKKYDENPIM